MHDPAMAVAIDDDHVFVGGRAAAQRNPQQRSEARRVLRNSYSRRAQWEYHRRSRDGGVMKRVLLSLFVLAAAPVFAQQQTVPDIPFDSSADFLKLPAGMNFGEVPGVAVNSKGHVFVFTRSNSAGGPAYAPTAAQLLEFGPKGEFIREIGKGLYGWSFAHSVRIDTDDNIWEIDKGSDMIIKFDQSGRVQMVFGRRKESADDETKPWEHG